MQESMPRCQQADKALQSANELVAVDEYGKGFAHFLLALTLKPALKGKNNVEEAFVDCLNSWSAELVSLSRSQDAVWCFEQACEVWPESGNVLHATGQFLFQSGHQREAVSFLRRAVRVEPHPDWLWDLQNGSSSLVERWHFRMLNDWKRNRGYYDALRRAVRKGHHKVLDIGSGTGLLSMLAIKSGASNVTACEMNKTMCELSEGIIQQNKMADRIAVNNMKSTDMTITSSNPDSSRYSLVVTEIADAGLLGEGIIPTLQHAWDHLLQEANAGEAMRGDDSPLSQIIPAGASVFIQVVECDFIRKQHRLLNADVLSRVHVGSKSVQLTFDPVAIGDGDMEPYSSEDLSQLPGGWKPLTSSHLVYEFNFCKSEILDSNHQKDSRLSLPVIRSGRADAIVSWFELHLDEETSLSSSPSAGSCWEQAIYPIYGEHLEGNHESGLKVIQEDVIDIVCRCHPTWMSFTAKDLKRKDSSASPSSNTNTECKPFKSKYKVKDANLTTRAITLKISSNKLSILNDVKYLNHLKDSLKHLDVASQQEEQQDEFSLKMSNPKSKVTILDASGTGLSLFALKSTTLHKNQLVGVIPNCAEGESLVKEILENKDEDLDSFRICKLESMEDGTLDDVSIILTDPVDTSGILRENALEDIVFFGMQSSEEDVRVIPETLNVCAVCVESDELIRNTRPLRSDLDLGVNVELINDFKTYTQLDIFLSTLPHRKLTNQFTVFAIDLGKLANYGDPMEVLTQENVLKLKATESGKIVAVVYWFEMTSGGTPLSTLDEDAHWMQAAFMLEKEVSVETGDELQLSARFRNNSLSFSTKKLLTAHPKST